MTVGTGNPLNPLNDPRGVEVQPTGAQNPNFAVDKQGNLAATTLAISGASMLHAVTATTVSVTSLIATSITAGSSVGVSGTITSANTLTVVNGIITAIV